MDNQKTGLLIAQKRKEKSMTQQELAKKLHVTNTAVSKWERGLSFPGVDILEKLADELDVTVMDILAGEIAERTDKKTEEISLDVMRTEKSKRKRITFISVAIIIILLTSFAFKVYGPVIFQRGYPVPYIKAMMKISENNPIIKVEEGIYITKIGDIDSVKAMMLEKYDAELIDQAGSGYFFSNGTANLTVSSEIYWRNYSVWNIPDITIEAK